VRRFAHSLRFPHAPATEMCWRFNFAKLPEEERCCRHQLAAECRTESATTRSIAGSAPNTQSLRSCGQSFPPYVGVSFSNNQLYHRGHTWVRPRTNDGTLTVGLDEFAHHLVGHPDSVQLPVPDSEIESDGLAWRMMKTVMRFGFARRLTAQWSPREG